MSLSEKILVGSFLILYGLAGGLGISAHLDPTEMDTSAYLSAAYEVGRTGGIINHIPNCLSGVYKEATQHPLYLLLLSAVAKPSVHSFVKAKFLTFGIGLIFVLVFYAVVRTFAGSKVGLVGACLLLLNATFIHMTTMVACEGLLALFFLLFWFFASRGFESRKHWLWAGLFASLTFLTKSLGVLLPGIFVSTVLWVYRKNPKEFLKSRAFWGFFLIFFAVASPLLIRNCRVYGTPLYSNSSSVLWIDNWHDYFRPDLEQDRPTLGLYLRTHAPEEILDNFLKGLFVRDPMMIVDGLKPFAFWQSPINLGALQGYYQKTVFWQGPWAFFIFVLALGGLYGSRKDPSSRLAVCSLIVFLIFVGWYSKVFPGTPPTRLLYPVLFMILTYAARAIVAAGDWILRKLKGTGWIGRWPSVFAGLFAAAFLSGVLLHHNWKETDLKKSYAFDQAFVLELRWVADHVPAGQKVLTGQTFMNHLFYFQEGLKAEALLWPKVQSLGQLEDLIRSKSIRYGVLDLATVAYNLDVYQPYFMVGPKIGLRVTRELPPPFNRLPKDPALPPLYELYEFNQTI